jgi:hypothetical protein
MFVEVQASHHTRHFHAYYQEYVAVYGIKPVELLAGTLPKRQQRLVEAWAELHQAELSADWNRLQTDLRALPLAPLAQSREVL